ncbi:MAG: hypothetical protein BWY48_00131 [Parcubacteria group bacterium ADurb.Bin305]|jgi:hypothetical protein|nr:MAG: hypothetical protein BWY48_00131 [Parcubacteria group bacterium ADurb.Bin305]
MSNQIQEKSLKLYQRILNSFKHLVRLLLDKIRTIRARMPKNYFFFLLVIILTGIVAINRLNWFLVLLLALTLTLFWKIFSGLSWFNVCLIVLGLLEISLITLFFQPIFVYLIALIFLVILFYKLFSPQEKLGRYLSFYFLHFFWIIDISSLYFLRNQSFWWSYLLYGVGVGLITFLYLLDSISDSSWLILTFLVITLVSLELFWLISFLSLPLFLSSLLTFINYWALISYGEFLVKQGIK